MRTSHLSPECYVKDWVDNTMIFLEVEDLQHIGKLLRFLGLTDKFAGSFGFQRLTVRTGR